MVLLSGFRLYGEKIPHWVIISGQDEDHFYIHDPFVPKDLKKADSINLALAKLDFTSLSHYGKAQLCHMLVLFN